MSRIITNVSSLLAQRVLGQNNQALTKSLERLSTGLRINRGADDPAGLIASENLRSEKAAISAAIGNGERAEQVVNIAEGGLTEVSSLLIELESLVDQTANDAGLSSEEKAANQLQIDSILQTIDRIANSTSFQSTKLLNGTFDYTTSNITSTELAEVNINAANIANGAFIGTTVNVQTSAQTAVAFLSAGNGAAAGQLNAGGNGSITLEVAGNKGVQQFTFTSNAQLTSAANAVNTFTAATGVSAAVSGAIIVLNSSEFGSSQFVSVTEVDGSIGLTADAYSVGGTDSTVKDVGRDAVININGTQATTDGLKARVSSSKLDVEVTISGTLNTDNATSVFQITGGGANFQLSPKLDLAGKVSIGLPSVTTAQLGSNTNGRLSLLAAGGAANVSNGDVDLAQLIVRDVISQVSSLRGRLGAFQTNTVGATIRSLGVALENTSAAESQIRDTDFANETAELTRSQILVNAATNALAIANANPQNVLALLG
ncbi:MAG: flagellin [Planctomycetaceae bacterium]|nr:flagellin [Planctomycetaceae bacterium]